jgi:ribosome-binding ATPase
MPRIGIVGFPNTGKTTLFNALTGHDAPTAPHPFSTTSPNIGVARIADPNLEEAARLEGSAKLVGATLDLLDLPAVLGKGGGLGAQYLGRLREMDALAAVLRAFDDPAVPADESGTDPVIQAEHLILEFTIADHEVMARRGERLDKEASADASKRVEAKVVNRASDLLAAGTPLRSVGWEPGELAVFRDVAPLTLRPVVWVVNLAEDHGDPAESTNSVAAVVPGHDTVVALSAPIEAEASKLDPGDRAELLEGLGLGSGALSTVGRAAYESLDLITFYTLGPKEAHAWTVPSGATASEAAGRIHSDLERGFIRAEVAPLQDVLAAGGWDAGKRVGKVRVEGRDYRLADRDVIVVRFSV